MEQKSSWEAKLILVSQEIPSILWNTNDYYHIHKWMTPIPIMRQFNSVYATHSTYWRSTLLLFFYPILGLLSCFFPSGFLITLYNLLLYPIELRAIFLELINRKLLSKKHRSLSTPLFSFFTPNYLISIGPKYSLENFDLFFFPHDLISTARIW